MVSRLAVRPTRRLSGASDDVRSAKYCDERVCACVRACVCPRAYLRNHTRDLYQIFVHVAYGRDSVLFRKGDEIPRGRAILWVFLH